MTTARTHAPAAAAASARPAVIEPRWAPGARDVSSLLWDLHQGTLATGLGPVATGFQPLDDVLDGGLLPGEVVLLGGQPGAGKTICALQWARHVAAQGSSALYACFEHDESALLNRLLVQEMAGLADVDPPERLRARTLLREVTLGLCSVDEAAAASETVKRAMLALSDVGARLHLLRASTQTTTIEELAETADTHLEVGGVLVVDYLQKLPVAAADVDERVYRAVEQLKDLAVTRRITVVALSAAGASGITVGRLRLRHLRGADALAHECDIAVVLNQKATALADRHLKFDLTQLDDARRKALLSIEKNRRGEVDVHLEFVKDFAHFRFLPQGTYTDQSLRDVDDDA